MNVQAAIIDTQELLLASPTHETTSGDGYKRTYDYRKWRREVTAALFEYGLDKDAELFGHCAETPLQWIPANKPRLPEEAVSIWQCSHEPTHDAALFMPTCDLRICPDCAARQSARLAARYMPKMLELALSGGKYALRHIVFTTPLELTSDKPDTIRALADMYSKLPRKALQLCSDIGKEHGRDWNTLGCIQSEEFGHEGSKLHFHVIQYGAYIPQKQLSEAWATVTAGVASVVYIRKIGNGSPDEVQNDVMETLKYSVKFWSKNGKTGDVSYIEPTVMPHLLRVLKGRRRVKSWGVFYDLPEPDKKPFCCKECHADMVRLGVENWSLWIDYGATYADIKAMRDDALLNLKLANKSYFDWQKALTTGPETRQKTLFESVPDG